MELSEQEKKCPYCAEIIKFEAVICRFCKFDLVKTKANSPNILCCSKCNYLMVTAQTTISAIRYLRVIAIVAFSIMMFFVANVELIIFLLLGLLTLILLSIIGKKTVLVCPKCGNRDENFNDFLK